MIGRPTTARFGPAVRASVDCAMRCGVLAAGAVLSGCATPIDRTPLPLQDAPAFSASGEAAAVDRWWTSFADPGLDARVDRALEGSFTLAAAWERLRQAEAVLRRERADRSVQIDATAGALVRDGSDVERRSELSLGLEATYEVDLWGRIRAAVEAERLRAAATAADYRTAAITLSAEVALAWFRLAEARGQVALVASQVETNETVLRVLEKRFETGQIESADVLRQRQLVEATREQRIVAEARAAVLEHLLAVLEGRPPQAVAADAPMPAPNFPELAPTPATGLPAELLQRRPDVAAASLRLAAADADVAAAVADRYPRIDLAAALSTTAENPSGLFDAWLASLAAGLVAPIIDGDRRAAEVERTEAVRRELVAGYGDTVLAAFREVEDALVQEADQARRIESLERQLALARATYEQLRTRYLNAAADFIDLLTTLREQQGLERDLLSARLARIEFRIALHRALAGGFETPREREEGDAPDAETESAGGPASDSDAVTDPPETTRG